MSGTVLYGLADSIVVLVGGLLLLPLYTATLSKPEFGAYIAIRTNLELLTYVLHFGMISAVSRLYFDYRAQGQAQAYLASIALWFPVQLLLVGVLLAVAGDGAWSMLSPGVAVMPNLAFALAIAAANFYFNLCATTLRSEQRIGTFVTVQLGSAAVLIGAAFYLLVNRQMGLSGLLMALLASAAAGAMALPLVFRSGTPLRIDQDHIRRSLNYALPIVTGLLCYFVLNRISIVILQRHVAVADLALYGLAQQIALIISVVGVAFGKALQPVLFAADRERLPMLMRQSMRLYVIALSAAAIVLLLFGADVIAVIAPKSYRGASAIMLILVTASFAYALTLASDTAVLCFRKPAASATITATGAVFSVVMSLILIPNGGLIGGATALLVASVGLTILADTIARRLTGFSNLGPALCGLAIVGATAVFARWVYSLDLAWTASFALRGLVATALVAILLLAFVKDIRNLDNPEAVVP